MLNVVHHADLSLLFVLLAIVAFGAAIWCAFRNLIPAAVACAFVGVVILLVS